MRISDWSSDVCSSDLRKIGQFCNIRTEAVIPALDVKSIYEVPLSYHRDGLDTEVLRHFGLLASDAEPNLVRWTDIMHRVENPEGVVRIAVVGKYTSLLDSYKSLAEALSHGGIANNVRAELDWIDAEIFEAEIGRASGRASGGQYV